MKKQYLASMVCAAMAATASAGSEPPTNEEMWQIIQQQQQQIQALQNQLKQNSQQIQETQVQVVATADAIDTVSSGPAAKLASWAEKTQFGGYGEVLYNNGTQRSDDDSNERPNKEIDVQRFVLFFGHQFRDDLRFFSELEIEHTNTAGGPGEVELEQAFIEWDYAKNHSVLAGLHLPPLGILNETHEPETFYGVERNRIESRIIPSTYRVIGVKAAGELAPGWSYDVGIHEGLQLADNFSIRSSRQSGARANAEELAGTVRLKYTGVPGLELGAALQYQSDIVQDGIGNDRLGRTAFDADGIDGLLTEVHAAYQQEQGFGIRALYARWDINDEIEDLGGIGRDEQEGWYLEPSWRFNDKVGIFTRYEFVDETAGDNDDSSEENRWLLGVNYWLHPSVVLKADIQFEDDEDNGGEDLDGFNLGIGWSF